VDGYIEDKDRIVLFYYKRYRVVKSAATGVYSLWYSGSIITLDPDRSRIMKRFKDAMANIKEATV
jgi:hypothetical protein